MKNYILLFLVSKIVVVHGHGRLMMPPARNSMWRLGYDTPVNYNDNELFCGGFTVQYEINDGKCGVCGDDYREPQPRPHEAGGLYATGTIGMHYVVNQEIEISAELTANHAGWFELKICPNNDIHKIVSQECLDMHPLNIAGKDTNRFYVPNKMPGFFNWTVALPSGVTCSQCVIQWTYFAGNTWGICENGTEADGCGPQETFVNCADVDIRQGVQHPLGQMHDMWEDVIEGAESILNIWKNLLPSLDIWHVTVSGEEVTALVVRPQVCLASELMKGCQDIGGWCQVNCLKFPPNCPPDLCKCWRHCEAVGEFAKSDNADTFCNQNCLTNPSYCPEERCRCT